MPFVKVQLFALIEGALVPDKDTWRPLAPSVRIADLVRHLHGRKWICNLDEAHRKTGTIREAASHCAQKMVPALLRKNQHIQSTYGNAKAEVIEATME